MMLNRGRRSEGSINAGNNKLKIVQLTSSRTFEFVYRYPCTGRLRVFVYRSFTGIRAGIRARIRAHIREQVIAV